MKWENCLRKSGKKTRRTLVKRLPSAHRSTIVTCQASKNQCSSVWLTLALPGTGRQGRCAASASVCRTRRVIPDKTRTLWHGFRIFAHTAPGALGVTRRSVVRIHSPLLIRHSKGCLFFKVSGPNRGLLFEPSIEGNFNFPLNDENRRFGSYGLF